MTIRSGKGGYVGAGAPNKPHHQTPRLKATLDQHQILFRQRVPGEQGETVTVAANTWTIASSAATGAVTFTLRAVSSRIPWSDLTWNNQPGVTGSTASVTITDPQPGDTVTFDGAEFAALAQEAINDRHFGWRLTSDSAAITRFYGFDTEYGPTLDVTTTEAPLAATDLVPNGVGSLDKPFLQWTAPDMTGEDNQLAFRVQTASVASPAEDAAGIWTAPDYDSGTVTDPRPELNLAATAYAGVADGAGFYWQVLWQSESGLWAPVSDTAHYVRDIKDAPTITNPTLGQVDSTQPTFTGTYPGTLKAWRMQLATVARPNRIIAGSLKQAATDPGGFAWQPLELTAFVGDERDPLTLQDGTAYRLTVDTWGDEVGRVASVGDPVFTRTVVDFTVNEDTGIEAPVLVSVAEHASLPIPLLTVTHSTMPDHFTVLRDGEAVATVDADEVHDSGTTYLIPVPLTRPMREYTWTVKAQVDGAGLSAASNAVAASLMPKGLWLVSRDLTRAVVLRNPRVGTMTRTDEAGVFRVQGRDGETHHVVVRSGRGKVDSGYSGQLHPSDRPGSDMADDLDAMWEADEWVYLIVGNKSLRVRLLDVTDTPNEHIRENREWSDITFRYVEVG